MNRRFYAFVFLILIACVGCTSSHMLLPDELSGFWTTSDFRYQGRFIELSNAYIIVGPGDGSADVQRIKHIDLLISGAETTYTIFSEGADGTNSKWTVIYENTNGGQLRLGNERGMVWKRCYGEQCGVEDKLLTETY